MNARQYPRKENVDDIALNHFCVHLGLRPNDSLQRPVECRSHRERGCKNSMLESHGTLWSQSHTTSTEKNNFQCNHSMSTDMEQSQITIFKEWTQYHIHRRKMSTILFWMHLCIHSKIAILPQFLTSNVHFVRKGCDRHLKIAILPQFLTSKVHFARKDCGGLTEIAILPQFLTSSVHFVRKGCRGYLKIAILP